MGLYRITLYSFDVGFIAFTYAMASKLPEWLLDEVLSLPLKMAELRNKVLQIVPHTEETRPTKFEEEEPKIDTNRSPSESGIRSDKGTQPLSGYSSEFESHSPDSNEHTSGSWINLDEKQE